MKMPRTNVGAECLCCCCCLSLVLVDDEDSDVDVDCGNGNGCCGDGHYCDNKPVLRQWIGSNTMAGVVRANVRGAWY